MRRIIGDPADHDQVLRDLEIKPLVAGDGD